MREYNYTVNKALSVGLRSTDKNRRNMQALVKSDGMVPTEGALASVELGDFTEIDISSISPTPEFPYPQVFELKGLTIVCTATDIYEYNPSSGDLTKVIGALMEGHCWSVADFHSFLMLCNGKQVVCRDGQTKGWTGNNIAELTSASCVCNYNGQIIATAPDVVLP
jgi:hypothetical protein